jgi:sugar lactone lactonase YvrE
LTDAELAAPIDFRISLKMRDLAGLQARIQAGQQVSQAEMEARYLPAKSDYDNLVAWVKSQGIPITLVDRNHTTVYLKASVAEISTIFGSRFARVGRNGAEYTSAITAPSLPASIAGSILSVSGLQTHRRLKRAPLTHARSQLYEGGTYPPYATPLDIADAYDFPTSLNGSGQTIAIYEDSPPSSTNEFATFWNLLGSMQSLNRVTMINPDGVSVNSDEAETTLDVEWAGALAPAAAIRVYVYSDALAGIGAVLNDVAKFPGLTVLSVSYGDTEADAYDSSYSQTFAQLAAAGVSVVVSSGDYMPNVDPAGVDYPASDPNVTGVGGTNLGFNTLTGLEVQESGFDYTGFLANGSYGIVENQPGASSIFSIPSWQASTIAIYNADNPGRILGDGQHRVVPDVSAFALGTAGVSASYIYALDYDNNAAVGYYDGVFGTSVSAPIWAAVCALINQERARLDKSPIGVLNPFLYPAFYLNQYNMTYPLSIPGSGGTYSSQYEYGMGLGRPDVNQLILCLADNFYAYLEQQSAAITAGGVLMLDAQASSTGATFQWQVNTGSGWFNLSDGVSSSLSSDYLGSTTPDLTIVALNGYPGGYQYRALATNALDVTAPTGTVTVALGKLPIASLYKGAPAGTIIPGTRIELEAFGQLPAGQTGSIDYQWELNGVPIPGQNQLNFVGTASTLSQGYYSVVIYDSLNPALSVTLNAGFLSVLLPDRLYHVSLLAGGSRGFLNGTGASATFKNPSGLAVDNSGNVFVADTGNNAIRMITPAGVTTTVAGQATAGSHDGTGTTAQFNMPQDVAVGASGNLYVADSGNSSVRNITSGGVVTTSWTQYSDPVFIAADGAGFLDILTGSYDISRLSAIGIGGGSEAISAPSYPGGLATDPSGNVFTAATSGVYEIEPQSGSAVLVAPYPNTIYNPAGIAADGHSHYYVLDASYEEIFDLGPNGSTSLIASDAGGTFLVPSSETIGGVASDAAGDIYFTASSPFLSEIYVATPMASVTQSLPSNPVTSGTPVVMSATASNVDGTPSFQWQLNGVSIPGATQSTLAISDPGAADRGIYSVVVTTNAGSNVLTAGTLNVSQTDAWLSNLSARANIETGANVLISGFEIAGGTGSTNKNVLVTGKGPVLQPSGISNFLPNPVVTLYDSQSRPIASNAGWCNPPVAATGSGVSPLAATVPINEVSSSLIINASGSAPAQGSADSMLFGALPSGGYTSIVADANGQSGVGITEVYDVDSLLGNSSNPARLSNVSARSFVGIGNQVLIVGFVVHGGPSGAPETVMIRAQGPNLVNSGILDALADTHITVYDSSSAPIASNSGWQNAPTYASGSGASPLASKGVGLESAPTALQLQYAGNALPQGSADSAMVVNLPPGAYTAILDPGIGSPGVGLVEVFELR